MDVYIDEDRAAVKAAEEIARKWAEEQLMLLDKK